MASPEVVSVYRRRRSWRVVWVGSLALLVGFGCSSDPGADGVPEFGGPASPPPANAPANVPAGNGAAPVAPAVNPAAGSPGATNPNEPGQASGAPISGNTDPAAAPGSNAPPAATPDMGTGGSSMTAAAGGGSALPAAPAEPVPGAPAPESPLPAPPGDAFFFDDFEAGAVGESPPNWDFFVAWVANQNNPSGNASALIDSTRAFTGTQSVRFTGGQNPAQITLPLPEGTNRLYVRAMVFMTRQLGQNPGANHETLIGIRGTPGQANSEIRFGEIKGVIGTNEVPSDNISPKQDQWGLGPAVAPNQWHCMEVQFLGDQAQNELYAYVDGQLVHSVTAPDQWNNGNLAGGWMANKFNEVILGWHSFSGIETDVWMDDVVLSTSPIGCD